MGSKRTEITCEGSAAGISARICLEIEASFFTPLAENDEALPRLADREALDPEQQFDRRTVTRPSL
ncbi:hypothetical protein PHLH6_34560 [Pseudomonas sp. Seg1]|uniref:hypothetical protein n=1 Tax=unclassified Pseudomonas TaxID=196821 RepID=UPI001BB311AC|nr:hypothetical protein [Pseudomonas sp. Seg1]BBP71452.1 hypothetical protein PHLH6_34560 [Pseudomonas sp. Seg1]